MRIGIAIFPTPALILLVLGYAYNFSILVIIGLVILWVLITLMFLALGASQAVITAKDMEDIKIAYLKSELNKNSKRLFIKKTAVAVYEYLAYGLIIVFLLLLQSYITAGCLLLSYVLFSHKMRKMILELKKTLALT